MAVGIVNEDGGNFCAFIDRVLDHCDVRIILFIEVMILKGLVDALCEEVVGVVPVCIDQAVGITKR